MTETIVRAFEMGDWEEVADLFQAPACQWGTLQMPYQSRDDIKAKLESPPPGMHRLVAVRAVAPASDERAVVGLLGLRTFPGRRAHVGGIGMFVHDDHQDQGVGSLLMEAAIELAEQWLAITRIELTVYTDNERAVHLYEKFGFVAEGTHLDFARRGGGFVDALAMARIRR